MSEQRRGPCPLCGLESSEGWASSARAEKLTACDRCGRFRWTEALSGALRDSKLPANAIAHLSARMKQASEQGRILSLGPDDLAKALHAPEPTVAVKSRKLLAAFAERSRPGNSARLNLDLDYPLLDAGSRHEMRFFADYLFRAGLITEPNYPDGLGGKENETIRTEVTFEGWQFLEPLRKTQMVPGRVFVAMSFDDDLIKAYAEGFKAAIADAECDPCMLKEEIHSENIVNKILAEIAQAEFVVADMTFCSHGAYFEAGYAMALGRKVVFTCREDHWDHIHFDTAQYPYIKWTTPEDLREKLRDWLLALKGQGG
jgi:hypothetical protein